MVSSSLLLVLLMRNVYAYQWTNFATCEGALIPAQKLLEVDHDVMLR